MKEAACIGTDTIQIRPTLNPYSIDNLEKLPPLPFMKTMDDAGAISQRENDNFYVTAFMIEAYTHDQVHSFSHHAPIAFDPDPEKREFAILGIQQRHFPEMAEFQKAWWEWHHGEAAERLIDSANWAMVGRAAADDQTTIQNYPALDQAIILFWPLVIRYNWTYRDLIAVIQPIAPTPVSYPCEREQDLASHCANVLGPRKDGQKGRTTKDGRPAGSTIAQALCGKGGGSVSS